MSAVVFDRSPYHGHAQKLGAGLYLRKPYSLKKIGLAVKQALTGKGA